MLRVAVVGDHGSGKTTFLALVYATLVRSGTDREDALRFHVAYDSLDEISDLYQRLMSGAFPDAAAKEGLHELRVELDSARAGHGLLSRIGSGKGAADRSHAVHFSLPGSLDEASPGLHRGSTFGTGKWRDALDADVLVMVADGARLAAQGTDPKAGPMAAYDGRLEALFIAIQRWRSSGGRPLLHPIFVLSKLDGLRSEVLKAANVEPRPPQVGKAGPRAAYGTALLQPNLPRTLALLKEGSGKKLRFAPPAFVFSQVHTEAKGASPREQIKLRRTETGGWEPDYSQDEYLAFLEEVAKIAAGLRE